MIAVNSSSFLKQSPPQQEVLQSLSEQLLPLDKLLFLLSASWLKLASDCTDSLLIEGHGSTEQVKSSSKDLLKLEAAEVTQVSSVPTIAHWSQIRQLSHDISRGLEQALREWVMIAPDVLSGLNHYIGALSQIQIPDFEASKLLQKLDHAVSREGKSDVLGVIFPFLLSSKPEMKSFHLRRIAFLFQLLNQSRNQESNSDYEIDNTLPTSLVKNNPPTDPEKPEESGDEDPHGQNVLTPKNSLNEALTAYEWYEDEDDQDEDLNQDDEIDDERIAAFERAIAIEEARAAEHHRLCLALEEEYLQQLKQERTQAILSNTKESYKKPRKTSYRKSSLIDVPQLIYSLRERYGVSQEEFASMVNVRYNTINRWENGHVFPQTMAIEKLKELTEELGGRGKDLLEKHFPTKKKRRKRRKSR